MGAPPADYDDYDHLYRLLEEGRQSSCSPTSRRRETKEFSRRRHTGGRLIYTLFSVLPVYVFYRLAMSVDVKEGGDDRTSDRNVGFCFGALGLSVLLANLWSFVRECWSSCPQAVPATVAAPPSPGPSGEPPPRGRTPVWASVIRAVSNSIGMLIFFVVVMPLATHCTNKDDVFTCVFLSVVAISFPVQGYGFTWDQP